MKLVENRKARHDYHYLQTYEAGIKLTGSEVKSIKAGKISLVDAFGYIHGNSIILSGAIIPCSDKNYVHEPEGTRILLLHKREVDKIRKLLVQGTTLIVDSLYLSKGKIKASLVVAKGKKNYDHRETLKKREADREMKMI
jgi:SsrA-binding protein